MIPYGRHSIEEDDIAAVVEVLRGEWITQGPAVARFEQAVAERCGARHAVACSSGTAALHLAILAAGVEPGDEIVAPAITFLATANCGLYAGAVPRFTDVDFDTVLMTAEGLEPALGARTRAVLPVHFAGRPCAMAEISRLVRARCPRAVLVEDACHALGGAHPDGNPVGSLAFSDMVVFSFHPVKAVATGEGGMVLTDRDDLADRLRLLRSHGMAKDPAKLERREEGPWYYEMHEPGFNYRVSDLNCALGLAQLRRLDAFLARRRAIAGIYDAQLRDLPCTSLPPRETPDRCAWHLYVLRVDFAALGKSRREVVDELRRRGIGTQVHYFPVPLQPYYRRRWGFVPERFPSAGKHYEQALTIPLFPAMSDADVGRVVDALHAVIRR